eukprot:scaffold3158_cov389-Prasinococcus_capsulatus_cf.AAC.21
MASLQDAHDREEVTVRPVQRTLARAAALDLWGLPDRAAREHEYVHLDKRMRCHLMVVITKHLQYEAAPPACTGGLLQAYHVDEGIYRSSGRTRRSHPAIPMFCAEIQQLPT